MANALVWVISLLLVQPAWTTCSSLRITTKLNSRGKALTPGSPFVVTAYAGNVGNTAITNLGMGFYLSNGICRVKPTLSPNRKPKQDSVVAGNNLYWSGLSMQAGKRVRIKLRGLINPDFAVPSNVSIGAVAYIVGTNCTVTDGPLTMSVQRAAKPFGKNLPEAKIGQCGLNPTPDDAAPYSLYATGQRCAQAHLVPVGGRRHLEWGYVDSVRQLEVTADTCWAACANQGYTAPFYMNIYSAGGQSQCFCCQDCDLVFDPNFNVYRCSAQFCGQAACGNISGRRLLDENGSVFVCNVPDIDMEQLPGSYADAESCVSGCMDADPSYQWAAWSAVCADACYCSATCAQAYAYFSEYDLYSFKQAPCPNIIPDT